VLIQFFFGKFKQRYNKYYIDEAGAYEDKQQEES